MDIEGQSGLHYFNMKIYQSQAVQKNMIKNMINPTASISGKGMNLVSDKSSSRDK